MLGSVGIKELRSSTMFNSQSLFFAEDETEDGKPLDTTDLMCSGTINIDNRRSIIARSGSMGFLEGRDALDEQGGIESPQDPQKKKSKGILHSMTPAKLKGKFTNKKEKSKSKLKDKGSDQAGSTTPNEPVVISPRLPPSDLEALRLSPIIDAPTHARHTFRQSSSPRLRSSLYNISPSFLDPLTESPSSSPSNTELNDKSIRSSSNTLRSDSPTLGNGTISSSKKIEKLLGDLPTNVFDRNHATLNSDEEEVNIQEDGITYNPRKRRGTLPTIKGATLSKLVEKLTHHSESDPSFLTQFLLTYRSFTTPPDLLNLLKDRFENNEAGADCEAESTKNKQVVRLRVFNVIKSWLFHHWVDFKDDPALIESIMGFTDILARDMNMGAKQTLVKIISRNTGEEKKKKLTFSKPAPKPHSLVYPPKEKLLLADIHPEEFARQITLFEFECYKAIKPWELLTHTLGQKKSPTITAMINRFNDISKWVQTEILNGETPKQRAAVFARLLEICEHLVELNNFNALMEIISGMNASAVFRLKATWGALSSKQLDAFEELNTLMSGNCAYKNLRAKLRTIGPPCIPYVGMYLTDLTFINDGNLQYLDNGFINFDKCRRLAAVIQEVMQYQQSPYCLLAVDEIQSYLNTLDFERDEDKIWQKSLQLEERSATNSKT